MIILELEDDKSYTSFFKEFLKREDVEIVHKKSILAFSSLRIDTIQRVVYKDDCLIKLTKNEYKLVVYLASHPNQIFSKEQIYKEIWNESIDNCTHSIENMISRLRKKIEDDHKNPKYITTVYGFGYKFTTENS